MKNKTILMIAVISLLTFTFAAAWSYGGKSAPEKDQVTIGTDSDDTIISDDGNDLVNAGRGNDKIKDGPGDDYIIAGPGNDTVIVGPGEDFINLGPGDDTLVINLKDDIGKINFAEGGDGNDTVIFVTDEANEIINNEFVQYYEKEKVYGRKIIDMAGLNVAAGLSGFEQVGVAASFSF